jgi:hypothetical protein
VHTVVHLAGKVVCELEALEGFVGGQLLDLRTAAAAAAARMHHGTDDHALCI